MTIAQLFYVLGLAYGAGAMALIGYGSSVSFGMVMMLMAGEGLLVFIAYGTEVRLKQEWNPDPLRGVVSNTAFGAWWVVVYLEISRALGGKVLEFFTITVRPEGPLPSSLMRILGKIPYCLITERILWAMAFSVCVGLITWYTLFLAGILITATLLSLIDGVSAGRRWLKKNFITIKKTNLPAPRP